MKFKLSIDIENAAFEDERNMEIARILEVVAKKLRGTSIAEDITMLDINGNKVGETSFQK